jgi:hypothetical protein
MKKNNSEPRERKDSDPKYKLSLIFSKTLRVKDCLEWQGNYFRQYKKGKEYWQYPYMYYKKKVWRGNRLVWTLLNGPIKGKLFVLHKCDNSRCINPSHLYLGDSKQNVKDAINSKKHLSVKKRRTNGQFKSP